MWWTSVKSGGDSGALRQVSDIGGGFGRASSTACCHPAVMGWLSSDKFLVATLAAAEFRGRCRAPRGAPATSGPCAPHRRTGICADFGRLRAAILSAAISIRWTELLLCCRRTLGATLPWRGRVGERSEPGWGDCDGQAFDRRLSA